MRSTFSPEDQELIKLLKSLNLVDSDYPAAMQAGRRAAFIRKIAKLETVKAPKAAVLQREDIIKFLDGMKPIQVEYPPIFLEKRRAAFIRQIEQREKAGIKETASLSNRDVFSLLAGLKPAESEYPQELLARRRAAFNRQLLQRSRLSLWELVRANIQNKLIDLVRILRTPVLKSMPVSLIVSGIIAAIFLGSVIYSNDGSLEAASSASPTQGEFVSVQISASATAAPALVETICRQGSVPPFCLPHSTPDDQALSFQGNGLAHAAVAKDALSGNRDLHQASFANDGRYGSGAGWISDSANSWIKIDLGEVAAINTVMFGKDRLGNLDGHNPGQFTIAVALADNVYANGDSSNDAVEYKQIYDSRAAGFSGIIAGAETLQAHFTPILARYIKITVANPGAAIDEVEAFFLTSSSTVTAGNDGRGRGSSGSFPTLTSIPTRILTATPLPTSIPTNTALPIPTDTSTSIPTDTALPIPTDTPMPLPTDTSTSMPTSTALPIPTDTPLPVPTDTPMPANTPVPVPTNTSVDIATSTSVPLIISTP